MADMTHQIVFDTSALVDVNPERPSPQVKLLSRLDKIGSIRMQVPELAFRERVSQVAAKRFEQVDKASRSLRSLQTSLWAGAEVHPDQIKPVLDGLEALTREELTRQIDLALSCLGFSVINLCLEDTADVWQAYFNGDGPFKKCKNRNDIPDGFIAAALKRRATECDVIWVCRDNALVGFAQKNDIDVVPSIDALLAHDAISCLSVDRDFDLWWEGHFEKITQWFEVGSSFEKKFEHWLKNEGLSNYFGMPGSEITHHDIPEDNGRAYVVSVGEPENLKLDWSQVESVGEGLLRLSATFNAWMELEFMVFRGEAFSVPDWVSVTMGDFEEDYFFDAYGSPNVTLYASVVVECVPGFRSPENEAVLESGGDFNLKDVSFDLEAVEAADETALSA